MVKQQKDVVFTLPEGQYSLNFLRALAMAAHLKLVQPNELTFWFDSGKTTSYVANLLFNRVIENRKDR